jgi:hypothetical protein
MKFVAGVSLDTVVKRGRWSQIDHELRVLIRQKAAFEKRRHAILDVCPELRSVVEVRRFGSGFVDDANIREICVGVSVQIKRNLDAHRARRVFDGDCARIAPGAPCVGNVGIGEQRKSASDEKKRGCGDKAAATSGAIRVRCTVFR